MFYAVQKVSDHPCFKMQELIYSVFYSAVKGIPFGKDIFPIQFTKPNKMWINLRGIRGDFEPLYNNLLALSEGQRKRIYSQLIDNNMIEYFCEDNGRIPDNFINYINGIGEEINRVLINCYEKLDLSHFNSPGCKLKPTHRYYRDYIKLNQSVCPFCSINSYKNPLNPRREDFDHYLFKPKYPLSAANMDNLVPMCSECNQDFKKTKDILYDGVNRVVAFYPFSKLAGVNIQINSTVEPNIPFARHWHVELQANDPNEVNKIENWDRIFSIKNRLVNEVEQYFEEWMAQELEEREAKFRTVSAFRAFMGKRSERWLKLSMRRNEPKALLKMAFFKYIEASVDEVFIKSYIQMHDEKL